MNTSLIDSLLDQAAAAAAPSRVAATDAHAAVRDVMRAHGEYVRTRGALGRGFDWDENTQGARPPEASPCVAGMCVGRPLRISVPVNSHYCSDFCLTHGGTPAPPYLSMAAAPVFWCPRHARVHVCVPDSPQCVRSSYLDEHGARLCVLSGRLLCAAIGHDFGDGTLPEVIVDEMRTNAVHARRASAAKRARTGGAAARVLRVTATGSGVFAKAVTAPVAVAVAAEPQYDADHPRAGLFGDAREDNTFGDAAGEALDEMYLQAYGTVHTLLYSEARREAEAVKLAARMAEAWRSVTGYVRDALRRHVPVSLCTCMALHARAVNAAHIITPVLLPHGALARVTAHQAMQVLELHVDVAALANALTGIAATPQLRKVLARWRGFSQADLFPTLLDHVREQPGNWLLRILYPEPHVIAQLGIAQRTCTEVRKHLQQVLMHARAAGMALPPPTCVEAHRVFDVRAPPVVSLFIAARARHRSC